MVTTTPGVAPNVAHVDRQLEKYRGFRSAAQEELNASGGFDPDLLQELRKLDDVIRELNRQRYLLTKPVKRAAAERESCPCCKRRLPAGATKQ